MLALLFPLSRESKWLMRPSSSNPRERGKTAYSAAFYQPRERGKTAYSVGPSFFIPLARDRDGTNFAPQKMSQC